MKKVYFLLFCLIFISGCANTEETTKNEYISMKNSIFDEKNYQSDFLPVDIITSIERVNEEDVSYKLVITNPQENMHKVKVLLVHNYYIDDVYPSIGIFDEPKELLFNNEKEQELILTDTIKTTTNISKLNLELKILIEYTDDNGTKKDIYYRI